MISRTSSYCCTELVLYWLTSHPHTNQGANTCDCREAVKHLRTLSILLLKVALTAAQVRKVKRLVILAMARGSTPKQQDTRCETEDEGQQNAVCFGTLSSTRDDSWTARKARH